MNQDSKRATKDGFAVKEPSSITPKETVKRRSDRFCRLHLRDAHPILDLTEETVWLPTVWGLYSATLGLARPGAAWRADHPPREVPA